MRKQLRRLIPRYAAFPLMMTGVMNLFAYQLPKLFQLFLDILCGYIIAPNRRQSMHLLAVKLLHFHRPDLAMADWIVVRLTHRLDDVLAIVPDVLRDETRPVRFSLEKFDKSISLI